MATGFQDPDLLEGLVDTSGCASLRSPYLQFIPLGAAKTWKLECLDIKNALLQADGFGLDVFLHAPEGWNPSCCEGVWKPKAPAYGLNDAPVAFHRSLKNRYLIRKPP